MDVFLLQQILHQNYVLSSKLLDLKILKKLKEINLKLAKLHNALFIESSPGPVKYAAELLELCSSETRLPLVPIGEETKKLVKNCQ